MQNQNFSITYIGSTELIQPMPFIHIQAKGNSFTFQADDSTEYASKKSSIITFDEDYWLCAYPTTQEFWEAVINESSIDLNPKPSQFNGKIRPVENVSWDNIQLFNRALIELHKKQKLSYASANYFPQGVFGLPSETQWEYATLARENFVFAGSQYLSDVAWFEGNSHNQTMPVGLKQPNSNSLYDMSGNVWEWCEDDYMDDAVKLPKNGAPNLIKDLYKSLRGGGCVDRARFCRLLYRYDYNPDYRYYNFGFRLMFSPVP